MFEKTICDRDHDRDRDRDTCNLGRLDVDSVSTFTCIVNKPRLTVMMFNHSKDSVSVSADL